MRIARVSAWYPECQDCTGVMAGASFSACLFTAKAESSIIPKEKMRI